MVFIILVGVCAFSAGEEISSEKLISWNEEHLNFGAEWKLFDVLSVRAGYRSLGYSDSQEGLTLGGGIEHNLINQFNNLKVRIDYSYQTYEYFNNVQTFGLELIY